MFQRRRHPTSQMNGHVGDEEINVLRRAKTDHFMRMEILCTTGHLLPQLGIGQGRVSTDNGNLVWITPSILMQIVFEIHPFSDNLRSTRATRLSRERRLRGVASEASRVMP